jgi:hypothetical protein
MGVSKKWLRIVRTKFLRSSNKDITLPPRTIVCTNQTQQQAIHANESTINSSSTTLFTKEDFAAIKIQAYFRGHLVCSIS